MKHWTVLLAIMLVGLATGCGPTELAAPAEPEKSEAELRRERWFGADIAGQPGIEWRSSGLGLRILAPGEGSPPKPSDTVRVFYTGRLKNGTVFDDNRVRGKASDFRVDKLIPGWAAAMPSLRPGGRAMIYVPPHLAYGGLRAGKIPPFSGLVFEVELLSVNP